jgi:nitrous oxide reductase accessory protein NosL
MDPQESKQPGPISDSSLRNSPQKILCCSKVQHYKTPISNNPENQEALDWFKVACGGNLPNDTHDPSKRVFWWAYKELYCVVSNGSRGSKKFKAVNFYGLSITAPGGKEVQKVTLIPESTVLAEKIEVVGASKAKDAAGRGIPCLVRAQGGMELSCKKHLDTIYTVYRVRLIIHRFVLNI